MQGLLGGARLGLIGLLMTVGSVLALVSPASASVGQTSISSPSSPFLYQFNNNASPAPAVTITGTANSTSPASDTIDINCYYTFRWGQTGFVPIASNVKLGAGGGFHWTGPVDTNGWTCQLRAVPHGYGTSGPLSQFAGVFSELDYLNQKSVNGLGTPSYDYFNTATSTNAYDDYNSVGGCGLDYATPINAGNESYDEYGTWNCAGALYGSDRLNGRSEILIDGRNAYDSYPAGRLWDDTTLHKYSGQAPGFPAVSSSYSKDPSTGNVTLHESEALVSCADSSFPATQAKCGGAPGANLGTWRSDGVSLARTILQSDGGALVTILDTFSSTDGQPHSLDLEYDNFAFEDNNTVWQLPGQTQYTAYTKGDQPSLSGRSVDVIYTRDGYYPDGSPEDGPGALIYYTQPNRVEFTSYQDLLLDYQRAVPAGGSITIAHQFMTGIDQASVQGVANQQLDRTYRPAVSITSPTNGAVTPDASIQVSGRAAAHDGLTLHVDGGAVPVNPDGTWSTTVSLHRGANTITASASDGSGNTAQAAEAVVYAPAALELCIVPRVAHAKLGTAERALRRSNCRVGRITKVRSRTFRKGRVEHASHSPGAVLRAGTKVGLTESVGRHGKASPRAPAHRGGGHRPAPTHPGGGHRAAPTHRGGRHRHPGR